MPFFPRGASASAPSRRDMAIGMNGLEIVETEDAIALETKIEYRPVTDEDFPALVCFVVFECVQLIDASTHSFTYRCRFAELRLPIWILASP